MSVHVQLNHNYGSDNDCWKSWHILFVPSPSYDTGVYLAIAPLWQQVSVEMAVVDMDTFIDMQLPLWNQTFLLCIFFYRLKKNLQLIYSAQYQLFIFITFKPKIVIYLNIFISIMIQYFSSQSFLLQQWLKKLEMYYLCSRGKMIYSRLLIKCLT